MRSASVDDVVDALGSISGPTDTDYRVVVHPAWASRNAHLAVARDGTPALLVPVRRVGADSLRLTHGLALRGAPSVEFARGPDRWREPVALLECRERQLLRTFAAMAAAIAARLATATEPSFEMVTSLFAEWERLLGRRRVLSGEAELGLWAEIWCLLRSSRSDALLEGWRGPEREHVDFLVDGIGVEVKGSTRFGSHFVSHVQLDAPAGDAPIVLCSMHVMPDPLRGRTLSELVREVAANAADVAALEEKLAWVGYSRSDEAAYSRRLALLARPTFFAAEDVPRVRLADPGVSDLRYRVELRPDAALSDERLDRVLAVLGLDLAQMSPPCV